MTDLIFAEGNLCLPTHNHAPGALENCSSWWFGEDVSPVIFCAYLLHHHSAVTNAVSEMMAFDTNVFGARTTLIVTLSWHCTSCIVLMDHGGGQLLWQSNASLGFQSARCRSGIRKSEGAEVFGQFSWKSPHWQEFPQTGTQGNMLCFC